MAIYAEQNSTPREPIEAGLHLARCYKMIEVGTVQELFEGKPTTMKKIRIGWEFPELLKVFKEENGPQPMVIEQEYTLSSGSKANLRKMLESWRGKPYTDEEARRVDVTRLLGQQCMINLTHKKSAKGKTYEVIASVVPVPKQMTCPPAINPIFNLGYDNFDVKMFESLPDFIKDKMKGSLEYKAIVEKKPATQEHLDGSTGADDEDSDLPF